MSAGAAGSDRSSGAPDVSVVIPTRNRWDILLSTALPAALAQEGVRLEVVVVDDGSDEPAPSRGGRGGAQRRDSRRSGEMDRLSRR